MINDGGMTATSSTDLGMSRRDALKRGALVGGAVVWATPAVQALTMTAASAQSPSPINQPPVTGKVPSHGIFLADVGAIRYGLKLDGSSNTFDKIASPSDTKFMKAKGFLWSDPTAQVLALFAKRGNGGKDALGEAALIVSMPAGAALVAGSAFAFDGGLQNCGNGDKYQAASIAGNAIIFYGACHE